ncbi:MAG: SCP2 sterol-binding domain-containing protein [Desulfobacterales bacterium]|nr:SCP2 sterol-binding domain-containing protein [Desulfobacterales bacterium]
MPVKEGIVGNANLHVKADSQTWISFLSGEKNLLIALMTRKIKLKGPPKLMMKFAKCFPMGTSNN